jgi:hypothetical protein
MATLAGATIASTYATLIKLDANDATLVAKGSTAIQLKTGDNDTTPVYLNTDAVGLGTASPSSMLHVKMDATTGSAPLNILILEMDRASQDLSIGMGPKISFWMPHSSSSFEGAYISAERLSDSDAAEPTALAFATSTDGTGTIAEKVRIDSAGNMGIGSTTPGIVGGVAGKILEVRGPTGTGFNTPGVLVLSTAETSIADGDVLGLISFQAPLENSGGTSGDQTLPAAAIWCEADGAFSNTNNQGELVFATADSETAVASAREAMRIDSSGNVGIGTDSPANPLHVMVPNGTQNTYPLKLVNADDSDPQGIFIDYSGMNTSGVNDAHEYLTCYDSAGGSNYTIWGSGNVTATNFSHTSDRRIKKDIADATSKLEDINKLKVRNFSFDYKEPDLSLKRIGFIADEFAEVFPSLVHTVKMEKFGIKYDDLQQITLDPLIPILVKAIQELSTKVTALEAKDAEYAATITALTARITTLENT